MGGGVIQCVQGPLDPVPVIAQVVGELLKDLPPLAGQLEQQRRDLVQRGADALDVLLGIQGGKGQLKRAFIVLFRDQLRDLQNVLLQGLQLLFHLRDVGLNGPGLIPNASHCAVQSPHCVAKAAVQVV